MFEHQIDFDAKMHRDTFDKAKSPLKINLDVCQVIKVYF